ncbi:unnamed protein product [Calypogeia fissa]
MGIKVYGLRLSTSTAMVLAALHEKEVEYELVKVDLFAGANRKPEYLALQANAAIHHSTAAIHHSAIAAPHHSFDWSALCVPSLIDSPVLPGLCGPPFLSGVASAAL